MKDRQNLTEWIDQYLLGELKDEALSQFRQRLESDMDFCQQVEMQQALFRQAHLVGRRALRQELKEMHQNLALPWPVENQAALQQAIASPEVQPPAQTEPNRDSRFLSAMVAYLALLQVQLRRKRFGRISYFTIAASMSLLLSASLIVYFLYRGEPASPVARQNSPVVKGEGSPQLALIRLERGRKAGAFGFGGAGEDVKTVAVLIYAKQQGNRSYRFDDTLRLYGTFVPAKLALRIDPKTEGYTLREDSLLFPLQRFRPRQALLPAH